MEIEQIKEATINKFYEELRTHGATQIQCDLYKHTPGFAESLLSASRIYSKLVVKQILDSPVSEGMSTLDGFRKKWAGETP